MGVDTLLHAIASVGPLPALLVLLAAWERLHPARSTVSSQWLLNVGILFGSLLAQILAAPALGILVTFIVNRAGGGLVVLPDSGLGLVAAIAIYFLAMDMGEYAFHRAQHAIPWLWAMHSLHHSDSSLGFTTTGRHFWTDPFLKTFSIWLAVGLLLRAPPLALGCYAIITTYNWFCHSNVRVGFGRHSWILNSPQYHRLHHSTCPEHYNRNFAALLPIFDVLTGAYRPPQPGEFPATGLADIGEPENLFDAFVWPLRGLRGVRAGVSPQ